MLNHIVSDQMFLRMFEHSLDQSLMLIILTNSEYESVLDVSFRYREWNLDFPVLDFNDLVSVAIL